MGLLDDSASDSVIEKKIQDIRQTMLDSMSGSFDQQVTPPPLWDKIRYASSIQSLWYLRVDLMTQLAGHHGETAARNTLATVTEAFRSLVPANQLPNQSSAG